MKSNDTNIERINIRIERMYRQNGDLTYLIKSARLSAGGGVIATFGNAQIDIA